MVTNGSDDSPDEIAGKVAAVLETTAVPDDQSEPPSRAKVAKTSSAATASGNAKTPPKHHHHHRNRKKLFGSVSVAVQTSYSFLASQKKKQSATVPKQLIEIEEEMERRKLMEKLSSDESENLTREEEELYLQLIAIEKRLNEQRRLRALAASKSKASVAESEDQEHSEQEVVRHDRRTHRASREEPSGQEKDANDNAAKPKPSDPDRKPRAWFVPFDGKASPLPSPIFADSFQMPGHYLKQQKVHQPPPPASNTSGLSHFLQQDEINLQDAFRQRRAHLIKRSQRRAQSINLQASIRKATAERRLANAAQLFQMELETRRRLEEARRHEIGRMLAMSNGTKVRGTVRVKRVFTHKEMRSHTERIYRELPEVKEKVRQKKKAEEERLYRLMAQVYTNRVKQQTLCGRINFPITQNMIIY